MNSNEEENNIFEDMVKHKWSFEQEDILAEWADKAKCYKWLHGKSHDKYYFYNACFTIPVIIMSTVAGTANFAQERFGEKYKPLVVMIIGSINILAGIITTIQQFLKIGQLNESHRVSSISWGKFGRNISLELAKHPDDRGDSISFIKSYKEEYDRLMETSPFISESITKLFKQKFNDEKPASCSEKYLSKCCKNLKNLDINEEDNSVLKSKFAQLKKPDICDSMEATPVYGRNGFGIKKEVQMVNSVIDSKKIRTIELLISSLITVKNRLPKQDEILAELPDNISEEEASKILKSINIDDIYSISRKTAVLEDTILSDLNEKNDLETGLNL